MTIRTQLQCLTPKSRGRHSNNSGTLRTRWPLGSLITLAALAVLSATAVSAQIQFTDVSAAAGLDAEVYSSPGGHSLGVNWIDYDRDGWPDLFVVGGDPSRPPHLFHNNGDGTFSNVDSLLPPLPAVEMSGSRFADYDNDGDSDIYIYTDNLEFETARPNLQDGPPNLLLKNLWVENDGLTGGPLFEEVAVSAGVEDLATPQVGTLTGLRTKSANWLDYDRDGCVDLFLGHIVMGSAGSYSNRDRLFRNLCDGTFENVSVASQINPETDDAMNRPTLAALAAHFDDDLWPDIYSVTAIGGLDPPTPFLDDLFFTNNGDGTFTETGSTMPGIGNDTEAGMGLDIADIDLDGDWDFYISDLLGVFRDEAPAGNALYLGNGDGTFSDNSADTSGVEGHDSWGVNFFDADHDGDEDLFVSTIVTAGLDLLYRNEGSALFTEISAAAGISTGNSRGSATADYDRDGDLDLAVVNEGGSLQLFRNDTAGAGNWIQLELVAAQSNRDAIGTVIEVTAGALSMKRQIKGGSSAHSQDSLVVHFGTGPATTVNEVVVRWPSGAVTTLNNQAANQFLTITEPFFSDGFESGDTTGWTSTVGN